MEEYKKYMLINENIVKIQHLTNRENCNYQENLSTRQNYKNKDISKNVSKNLTKNLTKNVSKNVNNNIIFDKDSDQLFWCFYIILYGEFQYEINNSFQTEKKFKIDSITSLKNIKSTLKNNRLRFTIIENELLNEKFLSIRSIIALSLLHNKNIMYISNNIYYEIINNSDDKLYMIYREGKNYKLNENSKDAQFYRENYFKIDNIDKPIKAITGYTKEELQLICKKLQINDIDNKSVKKDLYEKIVQKCVL